jgi:glycosyltransferase involved in cell wall biosynthesis
MTGPVLAFLGDRTWPPNAVAAERTIALWPEIARGIPAARLLMIGKPAVGARSQPIPSGIHDLSFVDDLDQVLRTVRGLLAPVETGGGVRVKILEAASIGLPVIGTPAALGSLFSELPLVEHNDDQSIIQAARKLLLSPQHARTLGNNLHEANSLRWEQGLPHSIVHDWLVSQ